MAGDLLCLCRRAVWAAWREDGVWPSGCALPKHCHGQHVWDWPTAVPAQAEGWFWGRLGRKVVTPACGPGGGWCGCLVSCVLDITLCGNEGQQEEDAQPLLCCWGVAWTLSGSAGACRNSPAPPGLLCRFTPAQLCWVPLADPSPGSGTQDGAEVLLSAGTEGKPHTAGVHTPAPE